MDKKSASMLPESKNRQYVKLYREKNQPEGNAFIEDSEKVLRKNAPVCLVSYYSCHLELWCSKAHYDAIWREKNAADAQAFGA